MLPLYRLTSFLLTGTSGAGGDELADGPGPGRAGFPRMSRADQWRKEPGARLEGARPLDSAKLQAPCAVCLPGGGLRLFYTAVGPAKPFPACQGYLLSAVSDDGLAFRPEPGIRLRPDPAVPHQSLRLLAPTI